MNQTLSSSQPVLILGMHRSGTSFLARLVQQMGVHIGDELVGGQLGNTRGHFEDAGILKLHTDLILQFAGTGGRAFDRDMMLAHPPEIPPGEADAVRAKMEAALSERRREGLWGWKEPRTCLFLSWWRRLLPEMKTIIVYRHPIEVHFSMLRRRHWDLALFPAQVLRAYSLYNQLLLEDLRASERTEAPTPAFVFNSASGYAHLDELVTELEEFLGGGHREGWESEFHPSEFRTIPVSEAVHACYRLFDPEGAQRFEDLQASARFPFAFQPGEADEEFAWLGEAVEPILREADQEERQAAFPFFERLCARRFFPDLVRARDELAEEMGQKVRATEEWNEKAAVVFRDNERLHADNERLGAAFSEQQAFLAKQEETMAALHAELEKVGKSWIRQRDYIKGKEVQMQNRDKEIAWLRSKLAKFEEV